MPYSPPGPPRRPVPPSNIIVAPGRLKRPYVVCCGLSYQAETHCTACGRLLPGRDTGTRVIATQAKLKRRWRLHTWNPGSMAGFFLGWLFSGGRYGRLPLYREDPVEDIRMEWEKAHGGLLNASRPLLIGEQGPEYMGMDRTDTVRLSPGEELEVRPHGGGLGGYGPEAAALAAIAWLWVVGLVRFVNWMLEVVP